VHFIDTSITIAARPETVWRIIVELDNYHEWNPFIPNASGAVTVGSVLTVEVKPPGDRAMTHRPTVIAVEPGKRLRWLGKLPVPGTFSAQHEFSVSPDGDGTLLRHSEEFRGLLVPFLRATLRRTEAGFHAMNQAVKERAELQVS
jgi:hypothetical protein